METNNIEEKNIELVEIKEKKYTFRKLVASDIGLMTSLIKNIGVNKIASIFKNEEFTKAMTSKEENAFMTMGVIAITELVQIIIEGYDTCEESLHKLLANVSNLSEEEVKELGMDEFFDMLFDFFKKDEFMGFFKRVLKSLGMAD